MQPYCLVKTMDKIDEFFNKRLITSPATCKSSGFGLFFFKFTKYNLTWLEITIGLEFNVGLLLISNLILMKFCYN